MLLGLKQNWAIPNRAALPALETPSNGTWDLQDPTCGTAKMDSNQKERERECQEENVMTKYLLKHWKKKIKKKIKGLHKRQVITRSSFLKQKKKRYKAFIFSQSSLSTTLQSPKKKEVREGRGKERGADDNSR